MSLGRIGPPAAPVVTLLSSGTSAMPSNLEVDNAPDERQMERRVEHRVVSPTDQMLEQMKSSVCGTGSRRELLLKKPEIINDVATRNWGVFEYWNIGNATQELIEFDKKQGWPFPKDPNSLVGQKYKVAQRFVYHINKEGKIELMRQYLDAGSVWAQFK